MSAPHEETWEADDENVRISLADSAPQIFGGEDDDGNAARAKLAACAPEMARMLLELEHQIETSETIGSVLDWGAMEKIDALLRRAGVR